MGPRKKHFYVIKFLEVPYWAEEKFNVVRSSWILSRSHKDTEAAFPLIRKTKLLKYVKNRKLPNHKWPVFRATTEFKTNVYGDALLSIEFRQNTDTFGDMMKSFKPKKKLPAVRKCSVMNGNVKTFGKAYNDIKLAGKGSNLLERTSDFSDESSLSDSSSVTYENEVSKAGNTRVLYLPMLVNKIKAIAFEHELLVKMHEIFSEAAKLLEVYVALRDMSTEVELTHGSADC